MAEENISQEFRLENIDETRGYFLEEIKQNGLMRREHKKVCITLNYIERFLILGSSISGCVSISAFASLIGIRIGIMSPAIELKVWAISVGIKKNKLVIKKKKKRHDEIALLTKSKLSSMGVLISKTLVDSVISHDDFILINNVLN